MVDNWVVPELGTRFPDSFSKMLIDYIYAQWTYNTGNLAKPATPTGQDNKIEFKRGFPSEFKSLTVNTLQGRTETREIEQLGQKRLSMGTQVLVTLTVQTLDQTDPDDVLTDMEQEISRQAGTYIPNSIAGIKDLIFERSERQYLPSDQWDKSQWVASTSILMWYELVDIT